MWKLHIANYFFFAFHTLLILFNLLGWMIPRFRRLHLISLLLTFFSWGILGFWKGWGYCPLTDWHYKILKRLGHTDLPSSYIQFLWEQLTGISIPARWVDLATLTLTLLAFIASLRVNFWMTEKPSHR